MNEKETLLHLQNGSDVRGVALPTEGGPPVTLTEEVVNQIAAAFGLWLVQHSVRPATQLRVGVGYDPRLSGQQLKKAIIQGLSALGVSVFDCGLASTPAMFMGTKFQQTDFDGAIMITASHLPQNRNGMKFFTREGGLNKQDIRAMLTQAAYIAPGRGAAQVGSANVMELYAAFLRGKIVEAVRQGETPLQGMHIVVDAGNGSGGFFATDVLEPLGADISGSQFLDPDGTFPNHQPNPENKEAMSFICKAVVDSKADFGIIFDTDVDRMASVISNGSRINRDTNIAMMAAILAPEYPGSTIVTDSTTSDRLTVFLQDKLGLKHHRFKRGYKNVINEAIRLNDEGVMTPLAIETSGHGAMQENYFLDDGAYMAVRLIIAAAILRQEGKKLESLLDGLAPAGVECECRIAIAGDDFIKYGQRVVDTLAERAKQQGIELVDSFEGVRMSFPGKGWAMLRMSLHDPMLPFNAEGVTEEDSRFILDTIRSLLKDFDRLDLTVM